MKDVLALVLAGGRVDELSVMTLAKAKAAVPFGGQNLIIDFVMSNLMLSDVTKVGILSQYRPSALIEHIGAGESWGLFGRGRYVEILPPFQAASGSGWYKGTADAVYQNLHRVDGSQCEHVLVLSGDHVYQMDYRPLLAQHVARKADLTAVFLRVPGLKGRPSRYGVADVDADGRLLAYEEKPPVARSDLASMTIYLFRREVLTRHVRRNAANGTTFQLYDEVLPAVIAEGRAYAHVFDGYWAYARTVDEYFQAHMDVVADPSPLPLDRWVVRTNEETMGLGTAPPALFGPLADTRRVRIASGARVYGTVVGSVLFPGATVAAGATVIDSVLLPGCSVEEGARVERTVVGEGVIVASDALVGSALPAPPNKARPDILASGVSLLGDGARVPEGCRIGGNCIVGAHAVLAPGQRVPDSATLDAS